MVMFSKNLKYYRLRNHLSKKDLADKAGVTAMAITNYEKGERKPSMDILKALAKALNVRISDFLAVRNNNIAFAHGEFRKNSSLSVAQQEYVRESVEEYFNRFMTAVEVLGGDVLPQAPACHSLALSNDPEENGLALRRHLGFAEDGPIEDLIGKLENKGILVYEIDIEENRFSGMNGFVNDRPYIVLNSMMNPERNRSTTIHELAHLMFAWPEELSDKEIEKIATAISGAFLFPKSDALRELGVRRSAITNDMIPVAVEYGISMMLLVKRAQLCNIVSSAVAKDFFIKASKAGWRISEPSRIKKEQPSLFPQLVYRAVNEKDISVQRGAELLKVPYKEVVAMSSLTEV
jgi:Zn-dependent peptidase ImmA (M78 family)/transcriptional regulator with XRE-family HTH domain